MPNREINMPRRRPLDILDQVCRSPMGLPSGISASDQSCRSPIRHVGLRSDMLVSDGSTIRNVDLLMDPMDLVSDCNTIFVNSHIFKSVVPRADADGIYSSPNVFSDLAKKSSKSSRSMSSGSKPFNL